VINARRPFDPIAGVAWAAPAFVIASRFASTSTAVLIALAVFAAMMLLGARGGFDLALDLIGAAAWGLAAFALGARFVSTPLGGLVGLGVFFSIAAMGLGSHLQEVRMRSLAAGACPRCKAVIASEHRHRRWETARAHWLPPVTSWECAACGYGHTESWACPACPSSDE
jgi:hypothetical protein